MKALLIATCILVGCSSDDDPEPVGEFDPELLLVTSFPDAMGFGGTSFVSTTSLEVDAADNRNAVETTIYPYITVDGDDIFVNPNISGDVIRKYNVDADGGLVEVGSLALESGGYASNILMVGPDKAYVSLLQLGRIVVFNPTTMTKISEIELTGSTYARGDGNPDPAVMRLFEGRVFVGLMQLSSPIVGHGGADLLVIDPDTDEILEHIVDDRLDAAGRLGWDDSIFPGPDGHLYVYCNGSGGFEPTHRHGFLRVQSGTTEFDPDYVFDLTETNVQGVPGGFVNYVDGTVGAGTALFGVAQVVELTSNPPDYVNDRSFQPIELDLAARTASALPLPASNGYASKLSVHDGLVLFGLNTAAGVGIYTFDPATGTASETPLVTTEGDPSLIVPLLR